MEEYISKKEVLKLIRSWWGTTVYVSKEPVVIKEINELPTIKADDGCCPECGANLEKVEGEVKANGNEK